MRVIQPTTLYFAVYFVAFVCCKVSAALDSGTETVSLPDSLNGEVPDPLQSDPASEWDDISDRNLQRRPPPPRPPPHRRPYYPPPMYRYPPRPPSVYVYPPPPPPAVVTYPPPPPPAQVTYPPAPTVVAVRPPPPMYRPYPRPYHPYPPPVYRPRVQPYNRHLQKLVVSNLSENGTENTAGGSIDDSVSHLSDGRSDDAEYDSAFAGDAVELTNDTSSSLEGFASHEMPFQEESRATDESAPDTRRQLFMHQKYYPVPVPYPMYRPYYRPPIPYYPAYPIYRPPYNPYVRPYNPYMRPYYR